MDQDEQKIFADIKTAAAVDYRMPPVWRLRYFCAIGCLMRPEAEEIVNRNLYDAPREDITKEDFAIWEKVCLEWMPVLSSADRHLIWWRAQGKGWKTIARMLREMRYCRIELHRSTLQRYFKIGLKKIKTTCLK
ncbi:MAG: hypothetical protein IJ184_07275 [Alphaproteobacteria bacterium]|nr:hypothetical protein [Alphaproteobacteria bacterium]